jgi:glycosyltransferase involved in cell wall biosynthesis
VTHVLQRFVFPSTTLCSDVDLYFHLTGGAQCLFTSRQLEFSRDGEALCDTYFNSFSIGKWKRHSFIDSLVFRVRLQGRFIIRFAENRPYASARIVHEVVLESATPTWHEVALPYDRLANGTLFARFTCTSDTGVLSDACFATHTAPRLTPRVAIIITTFNRRDYVHANLVRLQDAMDNDPALRERLHVVLVDNASNLDLESSDSLTYLKNANLGGAGGFSRGLLHVRELGGFTHVLFMDDDISFDVESVCRAIAFSAYARDPALCVAGAMFVESDSHVQFDAGASFIFDHPTHQLEVFGRFLDMRRWDNVMWNDAFDRPIRYGAWWFFLFPVELSGADLAFPVFVRGDDILFSYMYAKNIVSLNGVCVWHTEFDYKDSATTLYYNLRNWEVVRSVAGPADLKVWSALFHFAWVTLRENLTYRYGTAEYRIRGMRDFLRGPEWWEHEMDVPVLNAELRKGDEEAARALSFDAQRTCTDYYGKGYSGSKLRMLVQLLTLNGHLLPLALFQRGGARRWLPLQRRGFAGVFRQPEVVYWYEPTGEGFVARHSKARFFRNLRGLAATALELLRRYPEVRDAYRASYPGMVSPDAWRRRFGTSGGPAADTGTAPSKDAAA